MKQTSKSTMQSTNANDLRVFPPIQPDMYRPDDSLTVLTPDQWVARKIFALAHKDFTRWEGLVGWKLDALGQIGRLLLQHRLAMEAELTAQWKRADFFWNQVHLEIQILSKKNEVWKSLVLAFADISGVEVFNNPLKLRQRLVDELFIDTHFAFYNGHVQQEETLVLDSRAFVHIDYIQKLLNLSSLSRNSLLSKLKQPWKKRIALFQIKQKVKDAINLCNLRIKYFPNSVEFYKELEQIQEQRQIRQEKIKLAKILHNLDERSFKKALFIVILVSIVIFTFLLPELADAPKYLYIVGFLEILTFCAEPLVLIKNDEKYKAKQRRKTLEKLSKKHPYNLDIFINLSCNYHLYAIKLNQEGYLSEALFYVQKALTYNPNFKEAHQTRSKLIAAMQDLQARVNTHQYNPSTQEGKAIEYEADMGFSRMDQYMQSSEARDIASNFKIAVARSQISLKALKKSQSSKVLAYKIDSLEESLKKNPHDINIFIRLSDLSHLYAVELNEEGRLSKALLYVQKALTYNPNSEQAHQTKSKLFNKMKRLQISLINRRYRSFGSNKDTNLISEAEIGFSLANQYIKSPEAKAISSAFKLAVEHSQTENQSSHSLESISSQDSPILIPKNILLGEIKKEEPFLPWLFSRQDIRIKIQAFIASIMILITGGITIQDQVIRFSRNKTYQNILQAEQRQDYFTIIEDAESFLARTPLNGKNEQDRQVRQLYSKAIVKWIAQQEDPLDKDVQTYLKRYQNTIRKDKLKGN